MLEHLNITSVKSIAVLPFINISSQKENEYFCDGITEEIINALARIRNLRVTSRTSSFYFKEKNIPLKEIAKQLDVSIILEGSVRIVADKVRITAQLIEAKNDFHFWSETWDRKLENIFAIQDEISLKIADKIREQEGHFEIGEHLVIKQTDNVNAYALLLEARFYFNKWNPTDVKKAIVLYEKAIALDPEFTEAFVGLSDAYSFLTTTEFIEREEGWRKSVEYTQKAYALSPDNAAVHYLLANLSFFADCNYAASFNHAERSLELKPNYPESLQYMSYMYVLSGEMDKAYHYLQLALGIDPLNPETLFYKAYYYYRSGDYNEAKKILSDLLSHNPQNIPAYVVHAYCLLMQGNFDATLESMNNIPRQVAMPDELLGIRCLAYILKDDKANTRIYLEQLKTAAANPSSFQAHSYLFLAYANLKRYDDAFAWLEQALKMKSSVLLLSFSDPLASEIKADGRYKKFHQIIYAKNVISEPLEKKTPLIDEETVLVYTEKVLSFLSTEKPYLNLTLSLRELAGQIDIHPNQLSWLLNEKFGKKFNEFINQYRIEHFKQLANNPENTKISIIGLAYESGFNSKTVFNTFFKKEEGITPNEYLKSLNS